MKGRTLHRRLVPVALVTLAAAFAPAASAQEAERAEDADAGVRVERVMNDAIVVRADRPVIAYVIEVWSEREMPVRVMNDGQPVRLERGRQRVATAAAVTPGNAPVVGARTNEEDRRYCGAGERLILNGGAAVSPLDGRPVTVRGIQGACVRVQGWNPSERERRDVLLLTAESPVDAAALHEAVARVNHAPSDSRAGVSLVEALREAGFRVRYSRR